jgi:hypothetical protein
MYIESTSDDDGISYLFLNAGLNEAGTSPKTYSYELTAQYTRAGYATQKFTESSSFVVEGDSGDTLQNFTSCNFQSDLDTSSGGAIYFKRVNDGVADANVLCNQARQVSSHVEYGGTLSTVPSSVAGLNAILSINIAGSAPGAVREFAYCGGLSFKTDQPYTIVVSNTGFKNNIFDYSTLDAFPSQGSLAVNINLNAPGYATQTFAKQFLVIFSYVG